MSNHLHKEASLYLQQHAHNPVNWFPWGREAFDKAKKGNKLVLISIGYSSCHWCHVMEKEVFEDFELAQIMNQHFVCIKVDREERPDIDQIYMEAIQMLTGNGGWPLNCFALADGRPIYGGTYFPKTQWRKILLGLHQMYLNEPKKIYMQAEQLHQAILKDEFDISANRLDIDFKEVFMKFYESYDKENGGFGKAPKFIMPVVLNLMLDHCAIARENIKHIVDTLKKVAYGGIHDHLEGGFFRYSIDERWQVPHFEKMLYDNAQIIETYTKAYQLSREPLFKEIVYKTINFANASLKDETGAYFSSIDADSEGEEGKHYVWALEEFNSILGEGSIAGDCFGVVKEGNWENGKNVLALKVPPSALSSQRHYKIEEIQEAFNQECSLLLDYRKKRTKPIIDNKIICSWNAMMIKSLALAARVFNDSELIEIAQTSFAYLEKNHVTNNFDVFRCASKANMIEGFADDYAFLIDAAIHLFISSSDSTYIKLAESLSDVALKKFYDADRQVFYFTPEQSEKLIARKSEWNDNVCPSSSSTMTQNLFTLNQLIPKKTYEDAASKLLGKIITQAQDHPNYYSRWIQLAYQNERGRSHIVILGPNAKNLALQLNQEYIPNAFIIYAVEETGPSSIPLLNHTHAADKTLIYVCKGKTCFKPVESVHQALHLLEPK